jgi:hypothetical protein
MVFPLGWVAARSQNLQWPHCRETSPAGVRVRRRGAASGIAVCIRPAYLQKRAARNKKRTPSAFRHSGLELYSALSIFRFVPRKQNQKPTQPTGAFSLATDSNDGN